MADIVGAGIHTVRHDGTVAEDMVSLPIIERASTGLIVASVSIANGQVAEEDNGRNGVVGVIHPDAVVNTCGCIVDVGHLTKGTGGTNTKVIILIPIGYRARTDVGIGGFVFATEHGLAEARLTITEITCQTAVAHGEEVFVGVGEGIHLAFGQLRV